jgi:hypothetical protein
VLVLELLHVTVLPFLCQDVYTTDTERAAVLLLSLLQLYVYVTFRCYAVVAVSRELM